MDYDEYQEQRELLNQVRPRGRGSRGRRKPRKDGKPHTRKQSRGEAESSENVVRAVIEGFHTKLTDGQRAKTAKFLDEKFGVDVAKLSHPPALLKAVLNNPSRSMVIKAARRYLDAIVYAYSLYDWITSAEEGVFRMFILLVSEHTKIPLTPKFNLLGAVMRLAIEYEEGDPESDNRGKWSRDALAVEWLMKCKVRPAGVVAFQKKYGGGVDQWSRRMSKSESAIQHQNKFQAQVCSLAIEKEARVCRAQEKEQLFTEDDEAQKGPTNWGKKDLANINRNKLRLQKLTGGSIWESSMLNYYSRDKRIQDGQGMITLVVGDADSPLGCRLVGTESLPFVPNNPKRMAAALQDAAKAGARALARFKPKP